MRFRIEIDCDNAAFDNHPPEEVVNILRRLADRLEDYGDEGGLLRDSNGNIVGSFAFVTEEGAS